jgi:hypothetical protein
MCVRKLQSIEDPETFLCRSVLINNTLKTLQTVQREARAKKLAREQLQQQQQQLQQQRSRGSQSELEDICLQEEEEEDKLPVGQGDDSELDGGGGNSSAVTDGLTLTCDESYDIGGYNAEDILSDIVMPPPLSPQLEDMTHVVGMAHTATSGPTGASAVAPASSGPVGTVVVPASSSPSMSEGSTGGLSPLLSGHSPLSSGKTTSFVNVQDRFAPGYDTPQ